MAISDSNQGDGSPVTVGGQTRRWWLKKRFITLWLFLALASWHLWPLLHPHWAQEKCEFGTGSTVLYEKLRREAKAYLHKNGKVRLSSYWGFQSEGPRKFSVGVKTQLKEFAMTWPTERERYAAIHALLRQYGMEFDGGASPPSAISRRPEYNISIYYIALLPKLNWFCPMCYVMKEASFTIYVGNNGSGEWNQIRGLYTGMRVQNLNPKWSPIYTRRFWGICPMRAEEAGEGQ